MRVLSALLLLAPLASAAGGDLAFETERRGCAPGAAPVAHLDLPGCARVRLVGAMPATVPCDVVAADTVVCAGTYDVAADSDGPGMPHPMESPALSALARWDGGMPSRTGAPACSATGEGPLACSGVGEFAVTITDLGIPRPCPDLTIEARLDHGTGIATVATERFEICYDGAGDARVLRL